MSDAQTADAEAAQREKMAEWLASLVRRREVAALFLIIFVIVLSTYSISGQLILKSRQDVIDQATDINRRIESLEKDIFQNGNVTPPIVAGPDQSARMPAATITPLCDLPYAARDAAGRAGGESGDNPYRLHYVSAAQINLCAERQRNLNEGIAIAAQMLSWLQPIRGLGSYVAAVFGDSQDVPRRMGESPFLCYMVTHKRAPATQTPVPDQPGAVKTGTAASDDKSAGCGASFADILEYYGRVPEAVLQCLSLYLLPSLYGALGAILATIRYVRGRVAASLLNYVDRGRIQQDWVLGLVLGAVMGLFADYIAKANPVDGITLSAVALLAGYNVSAVFGLFEDISDRIFASKGGSQS